MRRVLVLDFDGTVCLGDEPVLAYAREVARALDKEAGTRVVAALESFLAGSPVPEAADAEDGYQTVARVALASGIDAEALGVAYRASRDALLRGDLSIHAPEGLAELLASLGDTVERVLVTNAPAHGMEELLERLELRQLIDAIVGDAGKPDGMPAIIEGLLETHALTREPSQLLSVGDIWVNDLLAAHERGCATALIDRFGFGHGSPDVRAREFPELYSAVRQWAAGSSVTGV